jgi:hypothetical protein
LGDGFSIKKQAVDAGADAPDVARGPDKSAVVAWVDLFLKVVSRVEIS